MARHFRSGLDAMMREAELEELEKKWAAENARIMSAASIVSNPAEAQAARATTPLSRWRIAPPTPIGDSADKDVTAHMEAQQNLPLESPPVTKEGS